jgi:hypothetical protein
MPALIDDETLRTFATVAPLDHLADELTARYGDLLDRLTFTGPTAPRDEVGSFVARFKALRARGG